MSLREPPKLPGMAPPQCPYHWQLLAPWAFHSMFQALYTGVWNSFLRVSTLEQEAVPRPRASTIQPWCPVLFRVMAVMTTVKVNNMLTKCLQEQKIRIFVCCISHSSFGNFCFWWSVPLMLTHSALEVTQGIQGFITWHFTSFPTTLLLSEKRRVKLALF